MRWYWTAAFFAFAVLSAAAVWMGGVNQDEGWYLYAANLVAEGKLPYRDFFFTQGPLMPLVYSAFTPVWNAWGLLGGRIFNLAVGAAAIVFAAALAGKIASKGNRTEAALMTFFLLGSNLYHVYFLAMPKTYALAGLLAGIGFLLFVSLDGNGSRRALFAVLSGAALSLASGARISLVALPAVCWLWLVCKRDFKTALFFSAGCIAALSLVYGPFLCDPLSRCGLLEAQRYHTARVGSGIVETVGSLSRLVRWYAPLFAVFALGFSLCRPGSKAAPVLLGFLAVFLLQAFAPFPYEDYHVPVMGLFAAVAASMFAGAEGLRRWWRILLVAGLSFAGSFGSPLLEKWSTDGQDRFWPVMKEKYELAKLRSVARGIEALDPGGRTLFTQDTYLAVETGRKVPLPLAMGPFSVLSDEEWRELLERAAEKYPVAALSGYTFAVEPPVCNRRSFDKQMEYWQLVKKSYRLVDKVDSFGQNSTTLLILKKR